MAEVDSRFKQNEYLILDRNRYRRQLSATNQIWTALLKKAGVQWQFFQRVL
jgi:hypothetical protein